MTTAWLVNVRIDAALEHLVEDRVERRPAGHGTAEVIPRECRQMPEIEDDGVAQRNRPRQHEVLRDEAEQHVAAAPGRREASSQGAGRCRYGRRAHRSESSVCRECGKTQALVARP